MQQLNLSYKDKNTKKKKRTTVIQRRKRQQRTLQRGASNMEKKDHQFRAPVKQTLRPMGEKKTRSREKKEAIYFWPGWNLGVGGLQDLKKYAGGLVPQKG